MVRVFFMSLIFAALRFLGLLILIDGFGAAAAGFWPRFALISGGRLLRAPSSCNGRFVTFSSQRARQPSRHPKSRTHANVRDLSRYFQDFLGPEQGGGMGARKTAKGAGTPSFPWSARRRDCELFSDPAVGDPTPFRRSERERVASLFRQAPDANPATRKSCNFREFCLPMSPRFSFL